MHERIAVDVLPANRPCPVLHPSCVIQRGKVRGQNRVAVYTDHPRRFLSRGSIATTSCLRSNTTRMGELFPVVSLTTLANKLGKSRNPNHSNIRQPAY